MYRLERLRDLFLAHPAIYFLHVRREANKVADQLENVGMEYGTRFQCNRLEVFGEEEWVQQCRHLADRDFIGEVQMDDPVEQRTNGGGRHEHTYTRPI